MRRVGRNRGGAAQRDRDIGLLQGDRIVDAVADEANLAAFLLQLLDIIGLLGRQHLGEVAVDAEFGGEFSRRRFVVAGDDRDVLNAPGAQASDDLGHLRSDRGT